MHFRRLTTVFFIAAPVLLMACLKASAPTRPPTALEYCETVARTYFTGNVECSAFTDAVTLTTLQAVEGAQLKRRGPDPHNAATEKITDIGYVVYRSETNGTTLGTLVANVANQMISLSHLMVADNSRAKLTVYVARGEISAAQFDTLLRDVKAFEPSSPR